MAQKGYSYAAMDAEAGTTSSTRSGSTKDRLEGMALIRVDDGEQSPKRVEKSSSVMAKEMCEEMHKDLFRLFLLEADEAERLELLGEKTKNLEDEHQGTKTRIEELQGRLKDMESHSEGSVRIKEEMLKEHEATIRELQYEREDLWRSTKRKVHEIELQIQEKTHKVSTLRRDIHYLEVSMRGDDPYPGPHALKFIDGDGFQLAAACVILSNLMVMFLQVIHPELEVKPLNMCFLAFYVAELGMNLVYKQGMYLCGELNVIWWNWMDAFIVVSGVMEFLIGLLGGADASWLSGLRFLRLLRLARVLKIVKIFMLSDLSWAESGYFQSFMMGVIGFNTILMGLETEYPKSSIWPYLEMVLLVIYSFELLIRMKMKGCAFFTGNRNDPEDDKTEVVWNWLDLIIVMGGVVDMWVMPSILAAKRMMGMEASHDKKLGQVMTMLRMARLARILRLAKLIKNIPPLYTLVIGIAKAMQGMVWVMLLTIVVLYICALLGVKLIGSGWVVPMDMDGDRKEVLDTFKDIPQSIFNLFKAMNADLGGVEPLLNAMPATRYIAMAFMVVTNWAIFSILTAVVSDNMAKVTEEHDREVEEVGNSEKTELRQAKLQLLFKRLDLDHDESLTREEFNALMGDEAESAEICHITGLEPADLHDLFDLVAKRHGDEQVETIRHHEFITLLNRECGQVTARSMMKIEKRLTNLEELLTENQVKDRNPPLTQRRLTRAQTVNASRPLKGS